MTRQPRGGAEDALTGPLHPWAIEEHVVVDHRSSPSWSSDVRTRELRHGPGIVARAGAIACRIGSAAGQTVRTMFATVWIQAGSAFSEGTSSRSSPPRELHWALARKPISSTVSRQSATKAGHKMARRFLPAFASSGSTRSVYG